MRSNRESQLTSMIEGVGSFFSELRLWAEGLFVSDEVNHFLNVPAEVIKLIIVSMVIKSPADLANLMFISKQFLNLLNDDVVWKNTGFDIQQYQQAVAYRNRYHQVIKQKGRGVALADQVQKAVFQSQPETRPVLNLFLIGDAEVGQELECESYDRDEIGYAFDGGAAMHTKLNGYSFTIKLCCDLSETNPYDFDPQYSSLISGRNKYRLGREMNINLFKKNFSSGGAHLVLVSLSGSTISELSLTDYYIKRFIRDLNLHTDLQDKAIVFLLDDVNRLFNYSSFITRLSINHPDIAGRVIGMMKIKPCGDAFHSLVENLLPMLRNAAFACETKPLLDALPLELKMLITEQLSYGAKNTLARTSKKWHSFFHNPANQRNQPDQPEADDREVCAIM